MRKSISVLLSVLVFISAGAWAVSVSKDCSDEAKPVECLSGINEENDSTKVGKKVEESPMFPGGNEGLMKWMNKNLKYPAQAQEEGAQGRVLVQFFVDKDGTVTEPKVVRPVHPALDAEALRLMSLMPKWIPGKQDGQPVRVRFTIPVSFRLSGGEDNKKILSPAEQAELDYTHGVSYYQEKMYEEAFKCFQAAANNGHKVAQTNLGVLYMQGMGVERNIPMAIEWFEKAARKGEKKAQFNLASIYHQGVGVKKDPEKAMYWAKMYKGQINETDSVK